MAINKFVSLDVPLMDLCFDTGIEHDRYRPIMLRWAKKCYSELVSIRAAVKKYTTVETFDGCRLKLPDHATVLQIVVMGNEGCDCDALATQIAETKNGIVPQQMYLASDINACEVNSFKYEYRIDNNYLEFNHSEFDGQQATIAYWGFRNDCDGSLMVNELAVDAIIAYIEVKLSRQTRWKNKEFRLSQWDIREIQEKYNHAFKKAKAELIQLSHQERRQMSDIVKNNFGGNEVYPAWAISLYND